MQTTAAIMGILNVTPDSFSDGGCYVDSELAAAQATDMIQAGATVVDIGGESTRPGAEPVTALEQIRRVVPVIEAVHQRWGARVKISIDTTLAAVADAAIIAGANMVNDVSAGTDDPELLACCAQHGCELVLMHRQGQSATMNHQPHYDEVVQEVKAALLTQADLAILAGVSADKLWLDPGIGFGKSRQHNLTLLGNLKMLVATGYPLLLGTSRKGFMGRLLAGTGPADLLPATLATTALGVMAGVKMFRVHDVAENIQALKVSQAIIDATLLEY